MSVPRNPVDRLKLLVKSEEGRKSLIVRRGEEAETTLTLLQEALDVNPNDDPPSRKQILKVMLHLGRLSGQVPPTLWLSNVTCTDFLKGGGFANVYKGTWSEMPVVLKVPAGKPDLKIESYQALLWRQLSHKNILRFLGLYLMEKGPMPSEGPRQTMISPWMSKGNIMEYLKKVPDADRYQLLIHASEGLVYLHGHEPPVIHSDLKPENILIDDSGMAVLADFGSSRVHHDLTDLLSSTQNSGTSMYMSPELLMSEDGKSTKHSDIWAFGMVIYQVFTGKRPYVEAFAINQICDKPPKLPRKPTEVVKQLGFTDQLWDYLERYCWAHQAKKRPTADGCRKMLKELQSRH